MAKKDFSWDIKAIGGGVTPLFGVKNEVDLIWKIYSLQSQRFLQNVHIIFLAQDIYD